MEARHRLSTGNNRLTEPRLLTQQRLTDCREIVIMYYCNTERSNARGDAMAATVKVREKFQVTIPENVRSQVPLQVGERVEVEARQG